METNYNDPTHRAAPTTTTTTAAVTGKEGATSLFSRWGIPKVKPPIVSVVQLHSRHGNQNGATGAVSA